MKVDRVFIFVGIILFILITFTYTRFSQMEQLITRQRIEGLNLRLDSLIATIKFSDNRYKGYSDDLKKIQERVDLMETEKVDLLTKVDNLSRELEGVRGNVLATNMDTNKKIVELGAISVKKHEKAKK
jgi:hypothetical protein